MINYSKCRCTPCLLADNDVSRKMWADEYVYIDKGKNILIYDELNMELIRILPRVTMILIYIESITIMDEGLTQYLSASWR